MIQPANIEIRPNEFIPSVEASPGDLMSAYSLVLTRTQALESAYTAFFDGSLNKWQRRHIDSVFIAGSDHISVPLDALRALRDAWVNRP